MKRSLALLLILRASSRASAVTSSGRSGLSSASASSSAPTDVPGIRVSYARLLLSGLARHSTARSEIVVLGAVDSPSIETSEKESDSGALKSPRPSAEVIEPKSLGRDDVLAVGDGGVGNESRPLSDDADASAESRSPSPCTPLGCAAMSPTRQERLLATAEFGARAS